MNPTSLTPREQQVLACVLRGMGNKQIAQELAVTEQAIKEHVSTLLAKFEVPNRAALAEAAVRLDLTGELGVDPTWVHQFFREAEPQICVLRGPELRYEAANDAFARATGKRPTIGRTMRETFPELQGQGIFERVERVYATGESIIEHEVVRSWDRGEGIERRVVDLVLQPLHGDDGGVNGVVSFAVDVTELVGARDAALVGEELAAIVDLVPSGVLVVDAHGRVIRSNDVVRRLLLRGSDLAVLASALTLCDAAGDPVAVAELGTPEDAGDPPLSRTFSLSLGASAGRVTFRAAARVLRDPGGAVRGAVLVMRDPSSRGREPTRS